MSQYEVNKEEFPFIKKGMFIKDNKLNTNMEKSEIHKEILDFLKENLNNKKRIFVFEPESGLIDEFYLLSLSEFSNSNQFSYKNTYLIKKIMNNQIQFFLVELIYKEKINKTSINHSKNKVYNSFHLLNSLNQDIAHENILNFSLYDEDDSYIYLVYSLYNDDLNYNDIYNYTYNDTDNYIDNDNENINKNDNDHSKYIDHLLKIEKNLIYSRLTLNDYLKQINYNLKEKEFFNIFKQFLSILYYIYENREYITLNYILFSNVILFSYKKKQFSSPTPNFIHLKIKVLLNKDLFLLNNKHFHKETPMESLKMKNLHMRNENILHEKIILFLLSVLLKKDLLIVKENFDIPNYIHSIKMDSQLNKTIQKDYLCLVYNLISNLNMSHMMNIAFMNTIDSSQFQLNKSFYFIDYMRIICEDPWVIKNLNTIKDYDYNVSITCRYTNKSKYSNDIDRNNENKNEEYEKNTEKDFLLDSIEKENSRNIISSAIEQINQRKKTLSYSQSIIGMKSIEIKTKHKGIRLGMNTVKSSAYEMNKYNQLLNVNENNSSRKMRREASLGIFHDKEMKLHRNFSNFLKIPTKTRTIDSKAVHDEKSNESNKKNHKISISTTISQEIDRKYIVKGENKNEPMKEKKENENLNENKNKNEGRNEENDEINMKLSRNIMTNEYNHMLNSGLSFSNISSIQLNTPINKYSKHDNKFKSNSILHRTSLRKKVEDSDNEDDDNRKVQSGTETDSSKKGFFFGLSKFLCGN